MSSKKDTRVKKNRLKYLPKQKMIRYFSGLTVVLFAATIGVHILFKSSAQTPTSATLNNACGVVSNYDLEAYNPPNGQAPLQVNNSWTDNNGTHTDPIAAYPQFSSYYTNGEDFRLVSISGNTMMYVLDTVPSQNSGSDYQIQIYNLTSGSTTPTTTFPVGDWGNSTSSFTVDPAGNVYANDTVNAHLLREWSPTGSLIWSTSIPDGSSGVYGYTGADGNFYVAFNPANSRSGTASYNYTGYSLVYNDTTHVQAANNDIYTSGYANQDPNTGDILTVDSGTLRVYNKAGTLLKAIGSESGAPGFSMDQALGAVENPSGGYFITVPGTGIIALNSTGQYLGNAVDFQDANFAKNNPGINPTNAELFNGNIYYATKGLDPWDTNENKQAIYSITPAQLTIYTSYPQGSSGALGIGAGLTTASSTNSSTVQDNYFPSTATPAVNVVFYPWWSASISGFTMTYEVRSVEQLEANQPGTTVNLPLTAVEGNPTGPVYIPINLSGFTSPGAYEVSAHLYPSGSSTAIGADCLDYSVGASGADYNPAADPSGADDNAVVQAHQLGQNLVRSSYGIDNCISSNAQSAAGFNANGGSSTFNSMPTIDCSPISSDVTNAETTASNLGMTYLIQLADDDTSEDYALLNSTTSSCPGTFNGQSISDFQCASYQMASQLPVTTWEDWNEFNNDFGCNTGGTNPCPVVDSLVKTAYEGIKAVSSSEKVLAGSILGLEPWYWQNMVSNGVLNYMDGADDHAYSGDNRSMEEFGTVIPPLDANPGQSTNLGGLDQIKAALGGKSSPPIYDTEFGVWQSGLPSTYEQGNHIVRGTILQNSIGITNISVFENNGCYQTNGVNWGTIGCGHDGGDEPATTAEVTMQRMLDSSTVSGNRVFQGWINTGIPHAYAALYGPAAGTTSTEQGDVAVVWSDDFSTSVVPKLSGGGSINLTSEYGNSSTIANDTSLPISGEVQYINIPSGQTLTFTPYETFGANFALSSSGATATATSCASSSNTSDCSGGLSPTSIIQGEENDGEGGTRSSLGHAYGWAQDYSDTNPSVTITLPGSSGDSIDRIFLASESNLSTDDNLAAFDIQVSNGTTWTTVGSITGNFYQRNWLFNFATQNVEQIRIVNMIPNVTGYGDGIAPTFAPTDAASVNDDNNPWYGQDVITDVEAYGPGTKANTGSNAPTVSITTPANNATVSGTVSISSTASESGGTISNVQYLLDGSNLGGATTTSPYNYSWNTVGVSAGTHTLTAVVTDSNNNTATSSPITVTVNNSSKPTTPTLSLIPTPTSNYGYGSSALTQFTTSNSIPLQWTSSSETGGTIAGYAIYEDENGNYTQIGTTTATNYNVTGLSPDTSYSFEVAAYDATPTYSTKSNTLTEYTYQIGDIDGDSTVTGHDLSLLIDHYNTSYPPAEYDSNASVEGHDLSLLIDSYGKKVTY